MDVIDVVLMIAELVGLIALIYQSINLKVTIGNQIFESFVSNSLEIDRILIEYPQIRKYVYGGKPVDENTEDIDRIIAVVEMIVDISENIEVYKRYIPKNRRKGWMKFVEDIKKTPSYEYYMKQCGEWYESE